MYEFFSPWFTVLLCLSCCCCSVVALVDFGTIIKANILPALSLSLFSQCLVFVHECMLHVHPVAGYSVHVRVVFVVVHSICLVFLLGKGSFVNSSR